MTTKNLSNTNQLTPLEHLFFTNIYESYENYRNVADLLEEIWMVDKKKSSIIMNIMIEKFFEKSDISFINFYKKYIKKYKYNVGLIFYSYLVDLIYINNYLFFRDQKKFSEEENIKYANFLYLNYKSKKYPEYITIDDKKKFKDILNDMKMSNHIDLLDIFQKKYKIFEI